MLIPARVRGKTPSIYEGDYRVPFFVHSPKGNLPQSKDIDTLATDIDVLPTFADLWDIQLTDWPPPMHEVQVRHCLSRRNEKAQHKAQHARSPQWGGLNELYTTAIS